MSKIIYFIGTLGSGGKERRLIELLSYLKKYTEHEVLVVLRQNQIDYPAFFDLEIPYKVLTKKYQKKDFRLPFIFFKICKRFKPDIIHTWGSMPATVSIFSVILLRIPHINSQITIAPPNIKKWSFFNIKNRLNFHYSDLILSNSKVGLDVFKPPKEKSKVIYNGIRLERFNGLPSVSLIKRNYNINTKYSVVMVGSFSKNKNFDLFLNAADFITKKRDDITFICVGDGKNFERLYKKHRNNSKIIFTGRTNEVEALVNACDIGVLLSPNGEGISNSIMEYMALGKPVIANDAGGTKEIVKHEEAGYLLTNESPVKIQKHILELIDNRDKRIKMGNNARKIIEENFTIDKMGKAFLAEYNKFLKDKA